MDISSVMIRKVRSVESNATVLDAIKKMIRHKIGCVVVSEKGRVDGILTERDVLKRVVALDKRPGKIRVKDVMSKKLVVIEADASIKDAIDAMVKRNIKKLPVIGEGKLIGIVTATDILKSGDKIEDAALRKIAEFFPVYKKQASAG